MSDEKVLDAVQVECSNNHVYHERPHSKKGCPFCEIEETLRGELADEVREHVRHLHNTEMTLRSEQAAVARELRQDITLVKEKVDRFIDKRTDYTELSFSDPLQAMAWATAPEHRMVEVICEESSDVGGGLVYIARRV